MNQIYCDYNATSPLADSVKEYLAKGDFFFANPSSVHSMGKAAAFSIFQVSEYLKKTFSLPEHELFYHSGATEGVNTVLRNFDHLFYFSSDHPCVTELSSELDSTELKIGANGFFDKEEIIEKIKKVEGRVILNFTWVHNETGIVWDLSTAQEIKERTGCFIHVDAAQVIGKVRNFTKLNSFLDFYTFSAHKFGAMKAVGFTFYNKHSSLRPLLFGGGQQKNLRSGTLNAPGIKSIELALTEVIEHFNPEEIERKKNFIERELKALSKEEIVILGEGSSRNLNTINFLFKKEKADIVLSALDMNGIAAGSGSACSSASVKKSQTLIDMGYEKFAHHGIRISFGANFDEILIAERLKKTFASLL